MLQSLPIELHSIVFYFLDYPSKVSFTNVCKIFGKQLITHQNEKYTNNINFLIRKKEKKHLLHEIVRNSHHKLFDWILPPDFVFPMFSKNHINTHSRNTQKFYAIAAKRGSIEILKRIHFEHTNDFCSKSDRHIFAAAVTTGNLEICVWLKSNGFVWDSSARINTAKHGHLDVLKWLECEKCEAVQCLKVAAEGGHTDIVIWLLEQYPYQIYKNEDVCMYAARGGHIELLKLLRSKGFIFNHTIAKYAALYNHMDALRWLLDNGCPWWNADTLNSVAINGDLETLKWLSDCKDVWVNGWVSRYAYKAASISGNLDMLKWIVSVDDTKFDRMSKYECVRVSIKKGHIEIVKWLIDTYLENDFIEDAASNDYWKLDGTLCFEAISNGRLEILKFLVDKGCRCNPSLIDSVRQGHIDVIEWLIERGVTLTESDFIEAIRYGHYEFLRFLQ